MGLCPHAPVFVPGFGIHAPRVPGILQPAAAQVQAGITEFAMPFGPGNRHNSPITPPIFAQQDDLYSTPISSSPSSDLDLGLPPRLPGLGRFHNPLADDSCEVKTLLGSLCDNHNFDVRDLYALVGRAQAAFEARANHRRNASYVLRNFDSSLTQILNEAQEQWMCMRDKHQEASLRKHLKNHAWGIPSKDMCDWLSKVKLTTYEEANPEVFLYAMEVLVQLGKIATRHFTYGSLMLLHPDFEEIVRGAEPEPEVSRVPVLRLSRM